MSAGRDPRRFDDLFREFGPIALRRLFGGEGLYAGGTMFGIVFDDVIYLTTSPETRGAFLAEGCQPFTFEKRSTGEVVSTHWYTLPERLYDSPDELASWAREALSVAGSLAARRNRRRSS